MSNQSILQRISSKLTELENNKINKKSFVEFLDSSTEALENIPYEMIQESRELQYQIEIAGFADEEDCISDIQTVIQQIREWIEKLK